MQDMIADFPMRFWFCDPQWEISAAKNKVRSFAKTGKILLRTPGGWTLPPYHPQTQGKIERWHQTLKNRILLENYFLPGDLEAQIEAFVDHYNHQRYHGEPEQRHTRRRLLRAGQSHSTATRKDQTKDARNTPLASQTTRRIIIPTK